MGDLLIQYTEQQESHRRGADHRWISALPPDPDDPKCSSWNQGFLSYPMPYYFVLNSKSTKVEIWDLWTHRDEIDALQCIFDTYFTPSVYFWVIKVDLEFGYFFSLPSLPMLVKWEQAHRCLTLNSSTPKPWWINYNSTWTCVHVLNLHVHVSHLMDVIIGTFCLELSGYLVCAGSYLKLIPLTS